MSNIFEKLDIGKLYKVKSKHGRIAVDGGNVKILNGEIVLILDKRIESYKGTTSYVLITLLYDGKIKTRLTGLNLEDLFEEIELT